jgi:predicted NAD/FAD-dependent oxidoreductase
VIVMAGIAATVTDRAAGLSVTLIERTVGVLARAVVRVDELNLGLTQRNALQAVTANRAWRTEWEES